MNKTKLLEMIQDTCDSICLKQLTLLTLKVPITTAAGDKFCDIFPISNEIRNDIS